MDETGYIKLSDFGLSTVADTAKTFCGTADYLAPEMVSGM
jgi:serine/threonine protein kinase